MLVVTLFVLYTCEHHFFFFFKQKTAYEMRIRDWSSVVCSSDLVVAEPQGLLMAIPQSVDGHGEDQRTADQPEPRRAVFRPRHREIQHRALRRVGLVLIGLEHLLGVEAEKLGILAQEAVDIDGAGQFGEMAAFDRFQIGATDAQAGGNIGELQAAPFPDHSQAVANTFIAAGSCSRGGDRKGVVEGKRVSVRVDPGGRRTMKKKKK